MTNFNTEGITVKKIETRKPVVKDGQIQIEREVIIFDETKPQPAEETKEATT